MGTDPNTTAPSDLMSGDLRASVRKGFLLQGEKLKLEADLKANAHILAAQGQVIQELESRLKTSSQTFKEFEFQLTHFQNREKALLEANSELHKRIEHLNQVRKVELKTEIEQVQKEVEHFRELHKKSEETRVQLQAILAKGREAYGNLVQGSNQKDQKIRDLEVKLEELTLAHRRELNQVADLAQRETRPLHHQIELIKKENTDLHQQLTRAQEKSRELTQNDLQKDKKIRELEASLEMTAQSHQRELIAKAEQAHKEVKHFSELYNKAKEEIATLHGQFARAREDYALLYRMAKQTDLKLSETEAQLDQVQTTLSEQNKKLATENSRLASELEKAQAQLNQAESARAALWEELSQTEQKFQANQAEVAQVRSAASELNSELERARDLRQNLDRQNEALAPEVKRLSQERDHYKECSRRAEIELEKFRMDPETRETREKQAAAATPPPFRHGT